MKKILIVILSLCLVAVSCSPFKGHDGEGLPYQTQGTPEATALPSKAALPPTTASIPDVSPPLNAPASKEKDSFRFVVMGDSRGSDHGVNSEVVKKIMERIRLLSPQPDFAFIPGDLVSGSESYEGVVDQLKYFKKIVTAYYPAEFFYTCTGNHETSGSNGADAMDEIFSEFKPTSFLEYYGRTVYYLDRGKARLFMLNTDYPGEQHEVSDKQLQWVRENLNDTGLNFFFMHEPPFPTGGEAGFSLDKKPFQRDKLWDLVDASNDPLVFACHEHNYSRRHINSDFNATVNGTDFRYEKTVYQVVTGGFGAPLYPQYTSKKDVDVPPVVEHHFVVVDVNGVNVKVTAYNTDGKQLDSFGE